MHIGGILQAITLIGRAFVIVWSKNNMISYLISNIFNHHEIELFINKNIINDGFKIKNRVDSKKKLNDMKSMSYINNFKQNNNTNFINKKILKFNSIKNSNVNNIINNNEMMLPRDNANKNINIIRLKENQIKNNINIGNIKDNSNTNLVNNYESENLNNFNNNISELNNIKKNEKKYKNIYFKYFRTQDFKSLGDLTRIKKSLINKYDNQQKFFNFYDLICFRELLVNKNKRNFLKIAIDIIDKKLSIEYLLKFYSNFEKMKLILMNNEQVNELNSIPNFKIEKHLREFFIFNNDDKK